jgi:hypothetical protein
LKLIALVLLILRVGHFQLFSQIDPQLESIGIFLIRSWHFRMHNTFSSSHPLQVPGFNLTLMTLEILMIEGSPQHVRNSLKSSMRMIGKTCGEFNLKQIKHQERIHFFQMLISYDSDDFSALTLTDPVGFKYECHVC